MNAIITALIGGLCVAVPSIVATIFNNKRNNELINYRMNELTNLALKHEEFKSRIVTLEQSVRDLNERLDILYKK